MIAEKSFKYLDSKWFSNVTSILISVSTNSKRALVVDRYFRYP
jgi:hypothetical protein